MLSGDSDSINAYDNDDDNNNNNDNDKYSDNLY